MSVDTEKLREAVEALRVLNSAIWLAFPKWAIVSPETAKATEVIANYDQAALTPGDTEQ